MYLIYYFFDLIAKKSEIYKIPKWTQLWHENAQNRFGFYKARRREMILIGNY